MQHRLQTIWRWLKYKFLLLMRADGGASMIAMGFAIGIAIEMFTLPTLGSAFVLIFPLVYLLKGNLPAALIGFVIGKLIYIPMMYPNSKVGALVLPNHLVVDIAILPDWVNRLLLANLKLIVGGMINGVILGILCYYPILMTVDAFKSKRKEKRKLNRARLDARAADPARY